MVNGAHVSIIQSNTTDVDGDEISYVLSGKSDDGEFDFTGNYKCTISLSDITLANPDGAAINIANGKRIKISAKKGSSLVISGASQPTLRSGVTVLEGTAVFDGIGYVGATTSGGSSVSLSSYTGSNNRPGGGWH